MIFNEAAERAVIGAMILDPTGTSEFFHILKPDFFYKNQHKLIFECLRELGEENLSIIALVDRIRAKGKRAKDDASSSIESEKLAQLAIDIAAETPTSANIKKDVVLLMDKMNKRKLVEAAEKSIQEVLQDTESASEIASKLEDGLLKLMGGDLGKLSGFTNIKDVLQKNLQNIEDAYYSRTEMAGVPTGFGSLDSLLGGLQKGDLIIVGGRPGVGKTSFALNMAANVAGKGMGAAIFSIEMSAEQIGMRILCSNAELDMADVKLARLSKSGWARLHNAAADIAEKNIWLDDTPHITIADMRAKLKRLMLSDSSIGVSLVLVDYLQLVSPSSSSAKKHYSREQEVSDISRSLKQMAKEFNVPIVALSQLNRSIEHRVSKVPTLADLRESGAIEQDADVILFLHNDKDSESGSSRSRVYVAKHRNGPTGMVDLVFDSKFTKFRA